MWGVVAHGTCQDGLWCISDEEQVRTHKHVKMWESERWGDLRRGGGREVSKKEKIQCDDALSLSDRECSKKIYKKTTIIIQLFPFGVNVKVGCHCRRHFFSSLRPSYFHQRIFWYPLDAFVIRINFRRWIRISASIRVFCRDVQKKLSHWLQPKTLFFFFPPPPPPFVPSKVWYFIPPWRRGPLFIPHQFFFPLLLVYVLPQVSDQ